MEYALFSETPTVQYWGGVGQCLMTRTFLVKLRGNQLLNYFFPRTIIMALATSLTSCLDCVSLASLRFPPYDSRDEKDSHIIS